MLSTSIRFSLFLCQTAPTLKLSYIFTHLKIRCTIRKVTSFNLASPTVLNSTFGTVMKLLPVIKQELAANCWLMKQRYCESLNGLTLLTLNDVAASAISGNLCSWGVAVLACQACSFWSASVLVREKWFGVPAVPWGELNFLAKDEPAACLIYSLFFPLSFFFLCVFLLFSSL